MSGPTPTYDRRAIYYLRASGYTLEAIGQAVGLTRARIHQLCVQQPRYVVRECAPEPPPAPPEPPPPRYCGCGCGEVLVVLTKQTYKPKTYVNNRHRYRANPARHRAGVRRWRLKTGYRQSPNQKETARRYYERHREAILAHLARPEVRTIKLAQALHSYYWKRALAISAGVL